MRGVTANRRRTADTPNLAAQEQSVSRKTVAEVPLTGLSFHLRDTKVDAFQVRIGQGGVEYGKIVKQLERVGYKRALCAHLPPLENVDQVAELRKMRLLLESLL